MLKTKFVYSFCYNKLQNLCTKKCLNKKYYKKNYLTLCFLPKICF